jgi:hypothetical protein
MSGMDEQFPADVPGNMRGLAAVVVRARGAVALEREKRLTMTELTDTLADSGRSGQVIHRDPAGGEWSVTLAPAAAEQRW